MKKLLASVLFCILVIVFVLNNGSQQKGNKKNPYLSLDKLKMIDKEKDIDQLKKNQLTEKSAQKEIHEKRQFSFSVKPTEDFYNAAKENNYKVKETIKAINMKRPPINATVTVDF